MNRQTREEDTGTAVEGLHLLLHTQTDRQATVECADPPPMITIMTHTVDNIVKLKVVAPVSLGVSRHDTSPPEQSRPCR